MLLKRGLFGDEREDTQRNSQEVVPNLGWPGGPVLPCIAIQPVLAVTMQLKLTTPLTSILSRKGRGSKPPRENESPFSERN